MKKSSIEDNSGTIMHIAAEFHLHPGRMARLDASRVPGPANGPDAGT
jgi:hypothetical protein